MLPQPGVVTHPQGLAEGVDADGEDHELLHGQRVARVAAAVDDVERRHRQHLAAAQCVM